MSIADLNAIAFIIHCNCLGNEARPNREFVQNALIEQASKLETDDIGYIYDPKETHPELCAIAGQLVGKIGNLDLPYEFNLGHAVDVTVSAMLGVDDDYKKLVYVITDHCQDSDRLWLQYAFRRAENQMSIKVISIGKNYHRPSLEELCVQFGIQIRHFDTVQDFSFQNFQNPESPLNTTAFDQEKKQKIGLDPISQK